MPTARSACLPLAPILAFFCLTLLLVEAHEQVHALSTRLLCGGWAGRTFDNVLPYPGCSATHLALVDIAAPLFSYLCLWAGAAAMAHAGRAIRAAGFALLFASLPLGRLLPQVVATFVAGTTADEYSFVHRLAGEAAGRGGAGVAAIAVALVFTVPPLAFAWTRLPPRGRSRLLAVFCGLPLLAVIAWLAVANGVLAHDASPGSGRGAWPGPVAARRGPRRRDRRRTVPAAPSPARPRPRRGGPCVAIAASDTEVRPMIAEVLRHMPPRVHVLFAWLAGTGLRRLRTRERDPQGLWILPLLFVAWGLGGLLAQGAVVPLAPLW